jgi:hypothetical protein
VSRWRRHPAGGPLLAGLDAKLSEHDYGSEFAAEAGLTFGEVAALDDAPDDAPRTERTGMATIGRAGAAALAKSAPDLATRTSRAISAWQDHVMHLVAAENVTKRSVARVVSFDAEPLALVLTIGLLGDGVADQATSVVPQPLLTSLFGVGPLRDITAKARTDLHDRIGLLFNEEMLRFTQIIDAAGVPDDAAPAQLRQVTLALETAR